MSAPSTEHAMVEDVVRRLSLDSWSVVCTQVPLLGRSIDLVYLSGQDVVSVEFKLKDWRRALMQARDHRLGVDYAYICLPKREITEALRQGLADARVGLKFYNPQGSSPFDVVVEAPRSDETWPFAKETLQKYVSANRDEVPSR